MHQPWTRRTLQCQPWPSLCIPLRQRSTQFKVQTLILATRPPIRGTLLTWTKLKCQMGPTATCSALLFWQQFQSMFYATATLTLSPSASSTSSIASSKASKCTNRSHNSVWATFSRWHGLRKVSRKVSFYSEKNLKFCAHNRMSLLKVARTHPCTSRARWAVEVVIRTIRALVRNDGCKPRKKRHLARNFRRTAWPPPCSNLRLKWLSIARWLRTQISLTIWCAMWRERSNCFGWATKLECSRRQISVTVSCSAFSTRARSTTSFR